jgi:polyisoprenoid-binding protein YceI
MKQGTNFKLMLLGLAIMLVTIACQTGTAGDESQVAADLPTDTPVPVEPSPTAEPSATHTAQPAPTDTVQPTVEPSPTATATPTPEPTPTEEPGILRTYQIVQEGSEVRFLIDEVLLGEANLVVGRTNQVTGQVLLDLKRPVEVEVSPIEINARELATDNSFRNRAIRSQILDSNNDAFQFITFTPTAIDGLADANIVLGEPVTFFITGDLQIRDITNSVTFEMTATAVSETELSGSGAATVLRADYDLNIPSVPGVANVSEEVRLEIDFVAMAPEE